MSDLLGRLEERVETAARLLREAAVSGRERARAEREVYEEGRRAESGHVAAVLREAIADLRGEPR